MAETVTTSLTLFVVVGVACFTALLGHATVCAEQHTCLQSETCYSLNSGSAFDVSCSFRTAISPVGYRLLNISDQNTAMQLLDRGVCSPGLRQQVDVLSGNVECVRKRSWPNAFLAEIGDTTASTPHDSYCGKFISAGSSAYSDVKWGFFDSAATEAAVDSVVKAKGASGIAVTDLAKFRAACRRMVASNSAGAAATQTFQLFLPRVKTDTLGDALTTIGFLASHYCDTPALVGVSLYEDTFVVKLLEGVGLSESQLRDGLYAVGEDRTTREHATEFAKAMTEFILTSSDVVTEAEAEVVIRGSYSGTWLETRVGSTYKIGYTAYNYPMARFRKAFQSHGAAKAGAYLKGVAAVCSQAARSVIKGPEGNLFPLVHKTQPKESHASALGRLVSTERHEFTIRKEDVANASVIRLSSLSSLATATRTNYEVCLSAAKRVFPDDFDRIAFDALVTPTLYARLEGVSDAIREAAAMTLTEDLIGNVFAEYSSRSAAVAKIRATRLRIAGAPRGTWAGVERAFIRPDLTSEDSALSIITKQARAVFLDRLLPVVTSAGICEHPSIFSGVSRNAYLLLTTGSACVMILPGLIVPPFADERYDDASLYTRLGFVIAHEFMHVTAFTQQWDVSYANTILKNYHTAWYSEAIADVGAAATLLRFSLLTNTTVCSAVSQLFCGRVAWVTSADQKYLYAHPPTNIRGDNVCEFLKTYF